MSRPVKIGSLVIGGGNEIVIQSMTNVKTSDYENATKQIYDLYNSGCKIIRLAVSNITDIEVSKHLIKETEAILVADIQYDYRLAIMASDIGYHKIRINPGNIGSEEKIKEIVAACKLNNTVIRVGSNSGSIERDVYKKFGNSPRAIAESVLDNIRILEKFGFYDIIVSAKSSNVSNMIEANRQLYKLTDYPLHLGVTESGSKNSGVVKSAIGIGSLLCDGIGDTIRVSLTGDPLEEISAARQILRSIGLDKNYCEIVSCPTCSRCNYNLDEVVQWLENYAKDITMPLKIAIMGCAVNGPGEAKEADFGIAGGEGKAVVFKKGEVIKTIPFDNIYEELKAFLSAFLIKN